MLNSFVCSYRVLASLCPRLVCLALVDSAFLSPSRPLSQDDKHRTALMKAARRGSVETTGMMLAAGLADERDAKGRTALHHAAQHNQPHTALLLCLSGVNALQQDVKRRSAAAVAVKHGHYKVLRAIEVGSCPFFFFVQVKMPVPVLGVSRWHSRWVVLLETAMPDSSTVDFVLLLFKNAKSSVPVGHSRRPTLQVIRREDGLVRFDVVSRHSPTIGLRAPTPVFDWLAAALDDRHASPQRRGRHLPDFARNAAAQVLHRGMPAQPADVSREPEEFSLLQARTISALTGQGGAGSHDDTDDDTGSDAGGQARARAGTASTASGANTQRQASPVSLHQGVMVQLPAEDHAPGFVVPAPTSFGAAPQHAPVSAGVRVQMPPPPPYSANPATVPASVPRVYPAVPEWGAGHRTRAETAPVAVQAATPVSGQSRASRVQSTAAPLSAAPTARASVHSAVATPASATQQQQQQQSDTEDMPELQLLPGMPPPVPTNKVLHLDVEHPKHLCCPITMDLMSQPVVAADGHTYEADALAAWICSGHTTSPVTNAELPSLVAMPNHVVRAQVVDWIDAQLEAAKAAEVELKSAAKNAALNAWMSDAGMAEPSGMVAPSAPPDADARLLSAAGSPEPLLMSPPAHASPVLAEHADAWSTAESATPAPAAPAAQPEPALQAMPEPLEEDLIGSTAQASEAVITTAAAAAVVQAAPSEGRYEDDDATDCHASSEAECDDAQELLVLVQAEQVPAEVVPAETDSAALGQAPVDSGASAQHDVPAHMLLDLMPSVPSAPARSASLTSPAHVQQAVPV